MEAFDAYRSIAAPSEGLFKDNGSRFIALAYPVETEEEVKSVPGKPVMSGLFICREWKRKVELEDPEQSGLIPAEIGIAVKGARDAGAAGICLFTLGSMTPDAFAKLINDEIGKVMTN